MVRSSKSKSKQETPLFDEAAGGAGNNGGDGLFAMAKLAKRGVKCTAVLLDERAHPAALAAFQAAEIEKWWPIIRAAGIKAQ